MTTITAPVTANMAANIAAPAAASPTTPSLYLQLLTWAFALFSSARLFAYLPTIWAISASGQSNSHSLLTWVTWIGANLTMAAWLYEHNGRRLSKPVVVNLCNGAMCIATAAVILVHRI